VLITGGSRGLGLEIARRFAREGAHVTVIGRNKTTLEAAARELENYRGGVLAIPCDIRNQHEVDAAVREVVNRWGQIDVLVNNAGVIQVGPFEQMTLQDYENAMATHLWGPLYAILAVLPHMRKRHEGHIVNISSIGGKVGVPHLLPYSVSKFALAGLSEALSAEVEAQGIHVTSVFPGLMRTGSHVNAMFKGNHQSEFAWFSISASMPVLTINAQRAAAQIVEAARRSRKTLVITPAAKLASLAHGISPNLVMEGMRLANRILPSPDSEQSSVAHSGWQSQSRWSPSPLTRLSDRVIDRNNERIPAGELP
jgi:short-subunit dehydrogenase